MVQLKLTEVETLIINYLSSISKNQNEIVEYLTNNKKKIEITILGKVREVEKKKVKRKPTKRWRI